MAKIKRLTITNVDEGIKEIELLYFADGIAKWHSHSEPLFQLLLSS